MAWGHSEDVALDSGGNFSRFFSLSPQEEKVFCVRRFFFASALLFDFSEKVCENVASFLFPG